MNIVNYLSAIKRGYAISVFTGILIPVLLFLFVIIFEPFTRAWIPNLVIGVLVVAVPLLGIYLEGEGKRTSVIMLVLFVVSASFASWPLMDSFLVPVEHKDPRYYFITHFGLPNSAYGNVVTLDATTWKLWYEYQHENEDTWSFYEPNCYTVSYMEGNNSIAISDFYYRGMMTFNPYYSVPQALKNKLTCGYVNSIDAYGGYRDKLEDYGFKIEEDNSSFTATNNTTAVYCYIDGKHLVVAITREDDSYLLNQIMDR